MKQANRNIQFICPVCHYLEVSKRAKEFNFCPQCGADFFYHLIVGGKE